MISLVIITNNRFDFAFYASIFVFPDFAGEAKVMIRFVQLRVVPIFRYEKDQILLQHAYTAV